MHYLTLPVQPKHGTHDRRLGGGVTMTLCQSVGPLDTVTGEPLIMAPASPRLNLSLVCVSLAYHRADSNSSPRSIIDIVQRSPVGLQDRK
jgi:hypothetical protein